MAPTGIFNLPLELRQQIYSEILPKGKLITFSCRGGSWRSEGRTMAALKNADPRLSAEISTWSKGRKLSPRIYVSAESDFSRPAISLAWLSLAQRIEIAIEHYDRQDPDGFIKLQLKLIELRNMLSELPALPPVRIFFVEDEESVSHPCDPCWYTRYSYDFYGTPRIGTFAKTDERFGQPIVEQLLRKMLDLPRYESCTVEALIQRLDCADGNDNVGRHYDGQWQRRLIKAVERYIVGERGYQFNDDWDWELRELSDPFKYWERPDSESDSE